MLPEARSPGGPEGWRPAPGNPTVRAELVWPADEDAAGDLCELLHHRLQAYDAVIVSRGTHTYGIALTVRAVDQQAAVERAHHLVREATGSRAMSVSGDTEVVEA